jgi:hypothetical protein
MGILVRELHELVFDGGAVARADPGDLAPIEGREVKVILDNLAGGAGRLRHPTGNLIAAGSPSGEALAGLFHVEQVSLLAGVVEGKKGGGDVARLLLAFTEINRSSQDARRGAGLKSLQLNSNL